MGGGGYTREGELGRILVKIWTWMMLGARVLLHRLVYLDGGAGDGDGGQEDDGVVVQWVQEQRCPRGRQPSSAGGVLFCRIRRSFCLVFLPRWRWWIGQRDIRPRPAPAGVWPLLRAAVPRGCPLWVKTPDVI